MTNVSDFTLGDRLSDLWADERCVWRVDFDAGAGTSSPWMVLLEWTQEYGNPHHADWATYTWQFYGETVEDALTEAVTWCEALVPWQRCGECGGEGDVHQAACTACDGSGLDATVPDLPTVVALECGECGHPMSLHLGLGCLEKLSRLPAAGFEYCPCKRVAP